MSSQPRCPHCRHFLYLDALRCPNCEAELGYHILTRQFHGMRNNHTVIDGQNWYTCSNRGVGLQLAGAGGRTCGTLLLVPAHPHAVRPPDDTVALEKLAKTEEAKRRLVLQLGDLGLPIVPWDVKPGGLGFDLISSLLEGSRVMIGHANGIITIDLAESLDDRREALRVRLGEPYRTMLGHLRHEVGHYYQNVLLSTDERWDRCRALFGDERASYRDAIQRHYEFGAPPELASGVHLGVRDDAPLGGLRRDLGPLPPHHRHPADRRSHRPPSRRHRDESSRHRCRSAGVVSRTSRPAAAERLGVDVAGIQPHQPGDGLRRSLSVRLVGPVRHKLGFMHDIVTRAPLTTAEQYALVFQEETERA